MSLFRIYIRVLVPIHYITGMTMHSKYNDRFNQLLVEMEASIFVRVYARYGKSADVHIIASP